MKWNYRSLAFCVLCVGLCVLTALADGKTPNCSPDPRLSVDMPISLAIGTVRTPEFPVKHKPYDIDIRAQWNLPTDELKCRMGFELSPGYPQCRLEPLIEADWTVWEGDHVVAHGLDKGKSGDFEAGACYLARTIGTFAGESKHKYVVEVKLTKDGTPLNVTNPRIVVIIVTENAF